ncbi:beta strand repeat-containing protein [Marinobacterium stanieri]|uniref:beta strand repeat-containing protein n=1 Tax=Marinobacterium stanieri TaxID=49186 RepID=UPI001FD43700|nr:choice-of-anchor U domain-containing protein [Marinobacterium stanieri]
MDEVKVVANTNWIFLDNLQVDTAIPSNSTPTISIADTNLAYTEDNAATQLDSTGTVSDADGDTDWNGGTLEVQITGNAEAGDRLSTVDSDGDGTAITISGTDVFANGVDIGDLSASGGTVTGGTKLTITFDNDATNANVQEVLQSIRYDSTTNDPGTSNRTVTFTATDKNAASNSDTRTVLMTVVNDEPTLTATGSDPTFTEGGAAASLFSGTSIDTIESGQTISGLSFTITNVTNGSNERINVDGTTVVLTHGTNGSTAGNSLNYSVSVIGTTATVTMTGGSMSSAATQTLIDNISYQNNSNSPSTSNRVVTLTSIQDSGGTANGGDNTGSLAVASTVTLVQNNDEPTLTSNGSNPTFTEGGAAGSLFNGTNISTVEAGQTIKGLTFTVSNVTDGINEVVNIDGTALVLTHGTSGSTAGNSLSYSVTVAGTTATIVLTGGTLSTATAQTLIDNMSYQNNSNTPSTSNRVVTLTSVQDSGGTANSGDDTASLAVASTVTVVGVNDEPTLTATGSDPTFTEGGAAASLFSGTSIDTIESGQTISGLSFTITNVTNGSNERINVDGTTVVLTHGTNGSTAGNSLNYSVMVIGTTATVTMTGGSMSSAATQTLIDNMSYQNNSNSPSTSNRVVTLTSIQDSGGTANGGDNTGSLAVASTVTLVQINDAPTVSATSDDTMAAGGGAAVSIFSSTAISAVENEHIASVTFTVSGLVDTNSEKLNIDGSTVDLMTTVTATDATNGNIGYAVTYNSGTATVVITGTGAASAANTVFQTALDNMTYENTLGAVTTGNRVFTITEVKDVGGTANNGDDTWSTGITSTVTVLDATKPTASSYTDSGTEDTAVNLSATELPTAEDIGNEPVEYITIDTSTVTGGVLSLDSSGTAGTSTVGGINYTTTAGNLSGTVYINIADIGKLDITPTDNLAGNGVAGFDWTATDAGGQTSSVATYSLDITNTPDAPEGADKTLSVTTGGAHTFSASDFGFSDADTSDTLARVQITVQDIDNGSLELEGLPVSDGDWIAFADIDKLVYASSAAGSDSFTFTVEDSTGEADTTPNTLSISVTSPPPPPTEPETPTELPDQDTWDELPDEDGDGVPESVEDFVTSPTGVSGDGNDDGIADRNQQDVASVPFRNTESVSLEPDAEPVFVSLTGGTTDGKSTATGSGTRLTNVHQQDKPEDAPDELDMPLGLIAFNAEIEESGGTETFSLYVDDTTAVNGYWKQNTAGDWVNLASAEYGGKVVLEGSKLRLDFELTDGGEFDEDGIANGVIVDPGALGFGSESLADQVQALYIAYYQRPADNDGLDFWVDYLNAQDGSLESVVDAFATSAESQALYGDITEANVTQFLIDLYGTLFNRPVDSEGLAFYRNAFIAGEYDDGRPATAGTLMLDILQGAQNSDADLVELKLDAARTFTWLLDPDKDGEVMATYDAKDLDGVRVWLQGLADNDAAPGVGSIHSLIKEDVAGTGEPITLTGDNGVTELLF